MALSLADELIGLLEPLAEIHGLELVAVEITGAQRGRTVKVFLDRTDGIDIDTIAAANEWISEALEQVSRLQGIYTLEVSSPGIERILRKRNDFVRFEGQRVMVRTSRKIDGRASFTGLLRGIEEDDVIIDADGMIYHVPFESIERARLKYNFDDLVKGV